MRMKRTAALLFLLLALAGCSRPVANLHAPLAIAWNGTALTGAPFYARTFPLVTVQYARPSSPEEAERAGQYAAHYLDAMASEDRCCPGHVNLWLLPPGSAWPRGLPRPLGGLRAVGPGQLIAERIPTAQELPTGGDLEKNWMGPHLQVALAEPAGSPALTVDWLYLGMGGVLAANPGAFPANVWTNLPEEQIRALLQQQAGDTDHHRVATGLAALLVDRFGLRWTRHYPRSPEELTPEAALKWATGTDDTEEAFGRMRTRIGFLMNARSSSGPWIRTAADMSPLRLTPKLGALPPGPGPEPNRSPHRYTIKARLEPDTRTVTGELTLQWQNGEGIPVETLYFNLWPNAEQFAAQGGSITVTRVTVGGHRSDYTARGLDLTVPLHTTLQPGEQVRVAIAFATRLTGAQFRATPEAARFRLAFWYPTLAVLDDRGWNLTPLPTAFGRPYAEHAAYQVELDLPAGYALAATGRRTATDEQGARRVYHYEAEALQEFSAAGGPGLLETSYPADTHTLRILAATPDASASIAASAATTLALLEKKLGPLPPGEIALLEEEASPEILPFVFANRWYGEAIGSDRWGEPWLSLAFTSYAARFVQRQMGMELDPLTDDIFAGAEARGALALEALEQQLGPAAFGALLQGWTADYRYRTATTADFVARAEAAAGGSLAPFWQQWGIDPARRAPYEPVLPLGKVTLP